MRFALFISLVYFSAPVWARWAEPKDVGSVLQEYNIQSEVADDGSSLTIYEQIWRIQTEEGKINGSVREIEYNAFTDKVEILEAYTRNIKSRHQVPPTAIEDRDKGESRDYDPVKVKSLVFPQVNVGSVLRLKYRVTSSPAPIPGMWSLHFSFPTGVLVEKLTFGVSATKKLAYNLYDPKGLLKLLVKPKRVMAHIRHTLPGQVVGEKDAYFDPSGVTTLLISTEPDWSKHFEPLQEEFDKILKEKLSDDLTKQIQSWNEIKNPQHQLISVLTYISRDFRYFGDWRRVRGGLVPRRLSEIEKSRYGDCKDLSTLLTAILRQLGYSANVSLVERGLSTWLNKPEDAIANVGAFNHAITKAQRNGETYWLDATNSVVSLIPFGDIAGKPAWVMNKATKSFERLPEIQSAQYAYSDTETYTFQSNDVKVDVQADYHSQGAFRVAYGLLTNPREKMLFDVVDYYSEGQDLKDFKFLRSPPVDPLMRELKDMRFEFVYWTPSVTYQTAVGRFFALRDGGLSGSFYETGNRESDLQLADTPLVHSSKKILKNVKGVGEGLNCELKSQWMDVKREVAFNKSDIEIKQSAIVKIPVIKKAEYQTRAFMELQAQARKCFYRTGLIFQPL
jgi:hypothetical protein